MIDIVIESTGRNSLKETATLFDVLRERVLDIKEAHEFLVDRYGKLPKGKSKVYVDDKDGNAKVVGFLHSFWNKDISHNSKSWYQTDWITACNVVEEPIDILTN